MRYYYNDKINELNYLYKCWKGAGGYKLYWRIYITLKRFVEGQFYDDPIIKRSK
jgi:hypothetical protein